MGTGEREGRSDPVDEGEECGSSEPLASRLIVAATARRAIRAEGFRFTVVQGSRQIMRQIGSAIR